MADEIDEHRTKLKQSRQQMLEKWLDEHFTPALTYLENGSIASIDLRLQATFDDGAMADLLLRFKPGSEDGPPEPLPWQDS